MKIFSYVLILLLFFSQVAWADDRGEVSGIVRDKIGYVISLLQDKGMEKQARNEKIIEAVTPVFDFKRMASLSLGKKHWAKLSPAKRKEYTEVYIDRIHQSYLEKLDLYSDEKVVFKEAEQVKKRINVMTELISKGETYEMLYKFYKTKQGWKVYDIEILGVSLIQTYRSQFSNVLKNGSIDDLIAKLNTTEMGITTN